jgi:hypothetical protein
MDQISICLFLVAKGLNSRMVHIEFKAVLEEKVVICSTVTKYLCSASFEEGDAVQGNSADTGDADLVDQAILEALAPPHSPNLAFSDF